MTNRLSRRTVIVFVLFIALLFTGPAGASETESTIPASRAEGSFYLTEGMEPLPASYPHDGAGHAHNTTWGAVGEPLLRLLPRISTPNGSELSFADLESAPEVRVISNTICHEDESMDDPMGLSSYNWLWGQFITHDVDLTTTQNGRSPGTSAESAYYSIPVDDQWMNPDGQEEFGLRMFRSVVLPGTGTSSDNPRQHPNNITAWIDAGVIYGNDVDRANWLREFEGGRLKSTPSPTGDLLPIADYAVEPAAPKMSFAGFNSQTSYIAGDIRGQEHIALMAMHSLFVREHNRLATLLVEANPTWTDEQIYQTARSIVAAEMQVITYEEYLPSLGIILDPWTGHHPSVSPSVSNAFATVAFRIGHSQIGSTILRLDENRQVISQGNQNLFKGFFALENIEQDGGLDPVMRGLAYEVQPAADPGYVNDLRNFMFGSPGLGGQDMCAIDILRGRDHGVPPYVEYRNSLFVGLGPALNWTDITQNQTRVAQLSSLYDNISHVDAYVGMLMEDQLQNASFGPTLTAIWKDQFQRLRDADPSFYLANDALAGILDELNSTRLSDIILRNSDIQAIQCDVFFVSTTFDCSTPRMTPYGPSKNLSSESSVETKTCTGCCGDPDYEAPPDACVDACSCGREAGRLPSPALYVSLAAVLIAAASHSSSDEEDDG
ncbi:MAG TPA: peroxidase family protein [Candidatus Poseidoniales archaeon]|nr:peroxidase family protein [Candidatus Poseidoniales archaeon]